MIYAKLREDVGKAVMEKALSDRRGYRHTWDNLDDAIKTEIIEHVGEVALSVIRARLMEPTPEMVKAGVNAQAMVSENYPSKGIAAALVAGIAASPLTPEGGE